MIKIIECEKKYIGLYTFPSYDYIWCKVIYWTVVDSFVQNLVGKTV